MTGPLAIPGFSHVCIRVCAMEPALEFSREMLGFDVVFDVELVGEALNVRCIVATRDVDATRALRDQSVADERVLRQATTVKGRIMSLSSCSRMWQWYT